MTAQLLLIALGTLASEDLTLAATGLLVAEGKLSFTAGVAACAAGIFAGDVLLFWVGRMARRGCTLSPRLALWAARLCPAPRVERAAAWLHQRGLAAVLLSRFTPGLRLPTYFAAGWLPTSFAAFASYFLLAALIWTPLFIGAAGWVNNAIGLLPALGAWWLWRSGFLKRLRRWEFWPAWLAYMPMVPYFLYLAVRHRSLTVFTAANPAIPGGGLAGESKFAILQALARTPADTGHFTLIRGSRDAGLVVDFAARHGWPVVLKPDVGERGNGVAIVRSPEEARHYLRAHPHAGTILQTYLPGLEFGLFYYRLPGESRGHLFSITEKRFPTVMGDGRRTLHELIQADPRARYLAEAYVRAARRDVDSVPAHGESVQLVEIGSHCRGTVFLDGAHLRTPELESAVDRIGQAMEGFYFGRFDVRSPSPDDLRAGRFSVIELNGVAAEATHIYDPAVSLWSAYGTIFEQWRIAFSIGSANRAGGATPASVRELIQLVRGR